MQNIKRYIKSKPAVVSILVVLLTCSNAMAQSGDALALKNTITIGAIIILVVLAVAVALSVMRVYKEVAGLRKKREEEAKGKGEAFEKESSNWHLLKSHLWNRASVEKEADILLDHNYDGIQELDNHLPPWWTYLLYATIVFGVFYIGFYHFNGPLYLPQKEYEAEVAIAKVEASKRQAANVAAGGFDESALEYSDDPDILASGEEVYKRQCSACHKDDGGGSIGPNLTDNYWIHGGSIKEIYTSIKVGIPDKGMISWEPLLSPTLIRDVSSYVLFLKGSNPPGAKAAQGDLVE